MHPIFSITVEDIRRLDDEQSRELVARLCRAELRIGGISESAVSWGGDQRAKDGGVDVRVDVEPPIGLCGYIKKDRSAFQVKAEKIGKSKISGEMAPKGVLRPAIVELAESHGAYIIVSTRDSLTADFSHPIRIKAMEKCLSDHGLVGKVVIDFYDCRKIADWVEQHPAIAIWARHILGRPIEGWRSYGPWAYLETDIEAEYLIDDRVKVFMPDSDEGIDVLFAITHLRTDLAKNVSVRIVGLSGVGKTRLVQALFDKRVHTESPALDSENVIYTDLSDNPTPQPNAMLEALIADNADSIVVIDNCGQEVHQKLTETIKQPGCKIRLVTVEYDIRDDLPEGTICYRLEGSTDDVIKELLTRRYKILSQPDLDKIAEFSDGNARVAFALASTTETTGELARLRDPDLFRRLFHQKNAENDELFRCAEVASLLYSFNGEDTSPNSELALLSSLADVSVSIFYRHIAELKRRGLVQARGQWRAILPHAISNRLAAQAFDDFPSDILINVFVESATDRIARSFSRRMGYLHESKNVQDIVRKWLEPNGRYGDIAGLNEIGRHIFANIAPVDQKTALQALERATFNSDFTSTDNYNRAHFARIARSLAYEPDLFDQAAGVLMRFVHAETEGYKYDSSVDILKSLFFCHLSGTEAGPDQRAQIVQQLILSSSDVEQELGFLLLSAALETEHFSSSYGFDFGARKRGYGWRPRNHVDVTAWYGPFIDIAVEKGKNYAESGRKARVVLGESVRGLWLYAGMSREITAAAIELVKIDGWPEGWLGIKRTLQYYKEEIDEESIQELREVEKILAPRDLKAKIGAKVLARGSFADDLDGGDNENEEPIARFHRAEKEAEDLGKAAAKDLKLLAGFLPDLMRNGTNSKVWNFGNGVGQDIRKAKVLLYEVKNIVAATKPSSVSLIFLRGFISGLHKNKKKEVSAFLDGALFDDVWGRWLPELQLQVPLDIIGYKRLIKSLDLGIAPIWQYRYLAFGQATNSLKLEQITTLIMEIAAKPDGGLLVAIDVLGMVVHNAKEKTAEYRGALAAVCVTFLKSLNWSIVENDHGMTDHFMDEIIGFALSVSTTESDIIEILKHLVMPERSRRSLYAYRRGKFLEPFFNSYPRLALDAVYIADDDGSYQTALRIVSDIDRDRSVTAISKTPADVLIEWCEISPKDRYIFAAQTCCLFEKSTSDGGESTASLTISEVARRVLAGARDKKPVLDSFIDRLIPRSSSGSLSKLLRERLPLLAKLNPTGDKVIEVEIKKAEERLRKLITATEAFDVDRERKRTGSFE